MHHDLVIHREAIRWNSRSLSLLVRLQLRLCTPCKNHNIMAISLELFDEVLRDVASARDCNLHVVLK